MAENPFHLSIMILFISMARPIFFFFHKQLDEIFLSVTVWKLSQKSEMNGNVFPFDADLHIKFLLLSWKKNQLGVSKSFIF